MGLTAFNRHRRAKAAAAHKAAAAEAVEADESKTEVGPGDKPLDANMVAMGDTNALGAQPAGSEAMGTEAQQAPGDEDKAPTGDESPEQGTGSEGAQQAAESDESAPTGDDTSEHENDAQAGAEGASETDQLKAAAAEAGLNRGSATRAWREFAEAHGFTAEDAAELSRDELAEHFLGPKA